MELERLNYESRMMIEYLVALFYMTQKKYSCNRHKLNRLLVIASLIMAYNGKLLAKDIVLCNEDASIYGFGELLVHYPLEFYKEENIQVKRSEILDEEIVYDETYFPKYFSAYLQKLNNKVKELLLNVFKTFGAYPLDDLKQYLNDILPNIKSDISCTIDFQKVNECINKIDNKSNIIVNYILNYDKTKIEAIEPYAKDIITILKQEKRINLDFETFSLYNDMFGHELYALTEKYDIEVQLKLTKKIKKISLLNK